MSATVQNNRDLPAWFSIIGATQYSGLGRSLIYEYIQDGTLISSTVKRSGRRRGRRLVQRASLDLLIEAGIGGKSADNTGKNFTRISTDSQGGDR